MQNLKAHTTVLYPSVFGPVTVIVIEDGTVMFRANEVASLLGFSDSKGCVRRYASEADLVEIETDGGVQPVKCISFDDLFEIGIHSRKPRAADFVHELSDFGRKVQIGILKDLCEKYRLEVEHYRKCCEQAISAAKEATIIAQELLQELKNRCE